MPSVPAKAFSREFHSGGLQFLPMPLTVIETKDGWVLGNPETPEAGGVLTTCGELIAFLQDLQRLQGDKPVGVRKDWIFPVSDPLPKGIEPK